MRVGPCCAHVVWDYFFASSININTSNSQDELGVVSAVAESGERMLPVDWENMQGVNTGIREPRKVARVPKMNQLIG